MNPGRNTLLAGSASGVLQLLFISLLALISIPVFIHQLGPESYGIYSLLSLILTLPFFAGLGLNVSLVKFLAIQGKSAESKSDILATLVLQFTVLTVIIILIVLFRKVFLIDILGIPGDLSEGESVPAPGFAGGASSVYPLFFSLLVTAFFLTGQQLTRSVLMGFQLVWLTNLLQMVYNLLFYGSMIILLWLGYGLKEIGYAIALSSALAFMLAFTVTLWQWRKQPSTDLPATAESTHASSPSLSRFPFSIFHFHFSIFPFSIFHFPFSISFVASVRKQLSTGIPLFSAELVAYFVEPVSRVLLAHFVGIRETGYFDIAIRVKAQLHGMLTRLFDPFFPWIAQIGDPERLKAIVAEVEKKYLLLSLPLIGMLIFVLKPLLDLWLGASNNSLITIASLVISVTFLFTMTMLPFYYFMLARDHVAKAVRMNLVIVSMNVLLFFLLLPYAGFYAAVIALCASAAAGFATALRYQFLLLQLPFSGDRRSFVLMLSFFVLMIVVNALLFLLIPGRWLPAIVIVPVTLVLAATWYLKSGLFTWGKGKRVNG